VDSTFTTPWLMKPFDHGADLVFHSATKFLCGHGTVVGGVLVDSGQLRLGPLRRPLPRADQPYGGFHGMVFAEESTVGAFLLRARREGLRDFGACMSPHTAWLILQGIETLPLRMARHVENTRKVVAFLAAHPMVARSATRSSKATPSHALAKKLLPRGCGAVFSFDLKGRAAGQGLHRGAEDLLAPGQRRRLPLAGDPPGLDHALPHGRRRAGAGRHRRRARSACRSAWKTPTT
jgi:O-acetylhomoserine (thiol)-lyase